MAKHRGPASDSADVSVGLMILYVVRKFTIHSDALSPTLTSENGDAVSSPEHRQPVNRQVCVRGSALQEA